MTKDEAARVVAYYLQDHLVKRRVAFGSARDGDWRYVPEPEIKALKEELEDVLLGEWTVALAPVGQSWIVSYASMESMEDLFGNPVYPQARELLRYGVFCVYDLEPVTP